MREHFPLGSRMFRPGFNAKSSTAYDVSLNRSKPIRRFSVRPPAKRFCRLSLNPLLPPEISMRPLKEIVGRSIILCYREDPAQLVQSLQREGLNPIIQRQAHSPETAGWTSN